MQFSDMYLAIDVLNKDIDSIVLFGMRKGDGHGADTTTKGMKGERRRNKRSIITQIRAFSVVENM